MVRILLTICMVLGLSLPVRATDQLGKVFEASYEMIETDKGWQINGVTLKEAGLGA